jgi:hypothetical protein
MAAALSATAGTAAAQEMVAYQPSGCEKFAANSAAMDRDAVYARAACVAARAAVASPANGPLSREELLSILMLMSLQQSSGSHSS